MSNKYTPAPKAVKPNRIRYAFTPHPCFGLLPIGTALILCDWALQNHYGRGLWILTGSPPIFAQWMEAGDRAVAVGHRTKTSD